MNTIIMTTQLSAAIVVWGLIAYVIVNNVRSLCKK